ncbi:MAG: glycosyltransferase [Candidatus Nanoarchaeia archaeon]|nr:glycosyltransferase [Candidatus Nanoarchaeia archaeon]MDD5054204.1 glycosyltransferase [Candidatus Nanoarchaeia archaeon]MDD5499830.1 glycosyltransferase [Candidatus Nanoarchaeia archaeon]
MVLVPEISFIIPCFNEEKYLEKTLKSISLQSIPREKYEIIVSDGKSSDKTLEIAKKYADKVVSKKNKSISHGRNLGARIAKGKILVFLDADTLIKKSFSKTILNDFKNFEFDVGIPAYNFMSKKNVIIIGNMLVAKTNELIHAFTKKCWVVSGACIVCSKKAFEEIRGFNENLNLNEDVDFVKRISIKKKVKLINQKVYSSPRRAKKIGLVNFVIYSFKNYFSYLFNNDFRGNYEKTEDIQ